MSVEPLQVAHKMLGIHGRFKTQKRYRGYDMLTFHEGHDMNENGDHIPYVYSIAVDGVVHCRFGRLLTMCARCGSEVEQHRRVRSQATIIKKKKGGCSECTLSKETLQMAALVPGVVPSAARLGSSAREKMRERGFSGGTYQRRHYKSLMKNKMVARFEDCMEQVVDKLIEMDDHQAVEATLDRLMSGRMLKDGKSCDPLAVIENLDKKSRFFDLDASWQRTHLQAVMDELPNSSHCFNAVQKRNGTGTCRHLWMLCHGLNKGAKIPVGLDSGEKMLRFLAKRRESFPSRCEMISAGINAATFKVDWSKVGAYVLTDDNSNVGIPADEDAVKCVWRDVSEVVTSVDHIVVLSIKITFLKNEAVVSLQVDLPAGLPWKPAECTWVENMDCFGKITNNGMTSVVGAQWFMDLCTRWQASIEKDFVDSSSSVVAPQLALTPVKRTVTARPKSAVGSPQ